MVVSFRVRKERAKRAVVVTRHRARSGAEPVLVFMTLGISGLRVLKVCTFMIDREQATFIFRQERLLSGHPAALCTQFTSFGG